MNINLTLIVLIVVHVQIKGGLYEENLIDEIFVNRKLNKYARPVEHEKDAVTVKFGVTLQQIVDVNERNEMLITNLYLNYEWKDYKLSWNPIDYGNITSIKLPSKLIWTPDILLYNSAAQEFDSKYAANVVIYSDGSCNWFPPGLFTSSCPMDITWFPFDDQVCKMKFGSWTYTGNEIDLQTNSDKIDVGNYKESGEWMLIAVPAQRNLLKYECCPEEFLDVTFRIHLRRRTLYYGFNLIIPCALISSLTMMVFILPPDSGEKVSLGVTILLSLSVFSLIVADSVPSTSISVPIIGIYFQSVMLMCTFSVVMAIIILNLHHRKPAMHNMPEWIRVIICEWLAWLLFLQRPGKDLTRQFLMGKSKIRNLEKQEQYSKSLINNIKNIDNTIPQHNHFKKLFSADEGIKDLKTELLSILNEVRYITHKIKENDESEEEIHDWKFAAMVMDRFCLILFTFLTILTTVGCFLPVPNIFEDDASLKLA